MALEELDKDWLLMAMENAVLKAFNEHRDQDHTALDRRISQLDSKARKEARILVATAATLIAGWEWLKTKLGGSP